MARDSREDNRLESEGYPSLLTRQAPCEEGVQRAAVPKQIGCVCREYGGTTGCPVAGGSRDGCTSVSGGNKLPGHAQLTYLYTNEALTYIRQLITWTLMRETDSFLIWG